MTEPSTANSISRRNFVKTATFASLAFNFATNDSTAGPAVAPATSKMSTNFALLRQSLSAAASGQFKVVSTDEFAIFSVEERKLIESILPSNKLGERVWRIKESDLCSQGASAREKTSTPVISFLRSQAERLGLISNKAAFTGADAALLIRLSNALSGGMDLPLIGCSGKDLKAGHLVLTFSPYSMRALQKLAPYQHSGQACLSIREIPVPMVAGYDSKSLPALIDSLRKGEKIPFNSEKATELVEILRSALQRLETAQLAIVKSPLLAGLSLDKASLAVSSRGINSELKRVDNRFPPAIAIRSLLTKLQSSLCTVYFNRIGTDNKIRFEEARNDIQVAQVLDTTLTQRALANIELFATALTNVGNMHNLKSPFSLTLSAFHRSQIVVWGESNASRDCDPCIRAFSEGNGNSVLNSTASLTPDKFDFYTAMTSPSMLAQEGAK